MKRLKGSTSRNSNRSVDGSSDSAAAAPSPTYEFESRLRQVRAALAGRPARAIGLKAITRHLQQWLPAAVSVGQQDTNQVRWVCPRVSAVQPWALYAEQKGEEQEVKTTTGDAASATTLTRNQKYEQRITDLHNSFAPLFDTDPVIERSWWPSAVAKVWCDTLAKSAGSTTCTVVDVALSQFTPVQAKYVAQLIRRTQTIHTLNLAGLFGTAMAVSPQAGGWREQEQRGVGVVQIARALAYNDTVTHLHLGGIGCLGRRTLEALLESLRQNTTLLHLNVHRHAVPDTEALSWFYPAAYHMLRRNATRGTEVLMRVISTNCPLPRDVVALIAAYKIPAPHAAPPAYTVPVWSGHMASITWRTQWRRDNATTAQRTHTQGGGTGTTRASPTAVVAADATAMPKPLLQVNYYGDEDALGVQLYARLTTLAQQHHHLLHCTSLPRVIVDIALLYLGDRAGDISMYRRWTHDIGSYTALVLDDMIES